MGTEATGGREVNPANNPTYRDLTSCVVALQELILGRAVGDGHSLGMEERHTRMVGVLGYLVYEKCGALAPSVGLERGPIGPVTDSNEEKE